MIYVILSQASLEKNSMTIFFPCTQKWSSPAINTVLIGRKKEVITVYNIFQYGQEQIDYVAGKSFLNLLDKTVVGKKIINEYDLMVDFVDTINKIYLREPYDSYHFVVDRYGEDLKGFELGWAMATTANLAFTRPISNNISLFDENFIGWGVEDIDYAYQLKERGYEFKYSNEMINYHQKHPINKEAGKQLKRNIVYFCSKYPNLDVLMYYLSFQSEGKEFNYVMGNEVLREIEYNRDNIYIMKFVKQILDNWRRQQQINREKNE